VQPRATNIFWPITRDADGRVAKVHDEQINNFGPTGRQTLFTWRPDGQPASTTQHGVTTTFGYDASSGNLLTTADTLGRSLTLGYATDGSGNVTSLNDGTTTVGFQYDASNRLVAILDAAGNATTLGYTQAGCNCPHGDRITSLHTPDLPPNQSWSFGYDADGRVNHITDPLGKSEVYVYTAQGDLQLYQDRNQRSTSFSYDELGRPSASVDPAGRRGSFAYPIPAGGQWTGASVFAGSPDAQAPPTSLTASLRDGEYQIGLREHRAAGHPAQVEFYRDATFELSFGRRFDAYGRLTRREDRAGQPLSSGAVFGTQQNYQQSLSYNLNTPLPVLWLFSSGYPAQGFYESAQYTTNAEFDLTFDYGLATVRPYASNTYTRDTAGRITGISTTYYTGGGVTLQTLGVEYDPAHPRNVKELTSGAGKQTITYDSRGLVKTRALAFVNSGGATASLGPFTYDYDAVGRNTLLTYPDGHKRVQTWDAVGRLTSRCYEYPGVAPTRCYTA
jgi:YD repeat-containing protein